MQESTTARKNEIARHCPDDTKQKGLGKLGEYSDANTGLRAPCPNFHPKNVWMKIRTDSHSLKHCRRTDHFSIEKVQYMFPSVVKPSPLGERMVAHLSEDLTLFPIIGADLSEVAPKLPGLSLRKW